MCEEGILESGHKCSQDYYQQLQFIFFDDRKKLSKSCFFFQVDMNKLHLTLIFEESFLMILWKSLIFVNVHVKL